MSSLSTKKFFSTKLVVLIEMLSSKIEKVKILFVLKNFFVDNEDIYLEVGHLDMASFPSSNLFGKSAIISSFAWTPSMNSLC